MTATLIMVVAIKISIIEVPRSNFMVGYPDFQLCLNE